MIADNPAVDTEFLKRRIAELERSVDSRIVAAASSDGSEGKHIGGGEPPHGHKMATESDLRTAEIAAAEARTDTKIVRLEGKLDLVLSKIDSADAHSSERFQKVLDDGRHTRANAIVIGVSLALLIIGVVAAAPVVFDMGMKVHDIVEKIIEKSKPSNQK